MEYWQAAMEAVGQVLSLGAGYYNVVVALGYRRAFVAPKPGAGVRMGRNAKYLVRAGQATRAIFLPDTTLCLMVPSVAKVRVFVQTIGMLDASFAG